MRVLFRIALGLALVLMWRVAHAESALPEIAVQTIAMESANQSDYGQYLVASVIVNRAKGGSLERVCLARKQFSCWNDKEWAMAWLVRHYTEKARKRALNALERAIKDPYKGITHYHTTGIRPYWAKGKKAVIVEGSHAFYRGIK